MEIEHHDEREFVKWYRRPGSIERIKVWDGITLLLDARGQLEMPHVRDLGGGLHELRVRGGQQLRIVMLTYGRNDTQQRDIQRARRRMA